MAFDIKSAKPVTSGFDISTAKPVDAPPDVSKLKSAALGAAEGGSLGFGDEGAAGVVALAKKLGSLATGKDSGDMGDNYRKARDRFRGQISEAEEANPKTFTAGEIVGGAAPSLIPGVGELNLAKITALAGLQGLGKSQADLTKGDFGGAAADTAKGAGVGLATGLAFKGLGAMAPESLKNFAQSKALKALGYTKRFLNTPGKEAAAKEAAQTMLDKGVITPLATPEDMAGNVADLIDSSGQKIGDYLKTRGAGYDTNSAIQAVESLRPKGSNGQPLVGGLYDDVNNAINTAIDTIKAHGPVIPFEEANALKGVLQKAGKFGSSTGQRDMERSIAGSMRGSVDDSLEQLAKNPTMDEAVEAEHPGGGKTLQMPNIEERTADFEKFLANKKSYKAGSEVQDALANRLSSEHGNKTIGLTDSILGGTIAGGEVAAGHLPIGGAAAVAGKHFMERYGNQTMAVGADKAGKALGATGEWVAKTLKTNPQALGKYAGMFMKAAAQGGQGVALRHWILSNNDPEYRMMLRKQDNGLVDYQGDMVKPEQ